ncbi:PREDICTED: probable protein phosphatase CG10417 [Drosophila arizonae]|uniref:protein-serine/threonine phosphatase n=1 Tax=Drosophila arizonae TaxID=7263 RepID=A0ABM1PE61_DROAR|nr:PREDICTED: probable protein phosphatase CG10417 [Drosophila arizonae]
MGAYLSHPKTDKASTDEFNEMLVVGASSMQGWRNSQEDAHNSILNFDTDTSFFAVYDGHGGAEVAQYCADQLPKFLQSLASYKSGQLEQALKDAFLGFDKTLLEPTVVNTLKILAGEHNVVDEDGEGFDEEDDVEDLAELHEESNLPLTEVLGKYKGLPQTHDLLLLKEENATVTLSSSLRGRRAAAVAAEAVNKAVMDPTAKPPGSSTSAAAVAAFNEVDGAGPSSSRVGKVDPEDESTVSSSSSSASKTTNSSITTKDEPVASKIPPTSSPVVAPIEQNGSVTSSEAKAAVVDDNKEAGASEDAIVSASSDIAQAKSNGSVDKPAVEAKPERADISSTSKESEKVLKKVNASQEEESTDDDADYDENAVTKAQELAAVAESSSDDDMEDDNDVNDDDDDDDDDEDDDDDDEDENVSDDEEDEDQMANNDFCANMIEEPGKDSGCTAVVGLLHGRDLYVANAGDSRCVICRNGKAIDMSLDHKPEDDEESARIIKAGGRVTLDGRVNGGLNLSRALGDHAYKTNLELPAEAQMISALPDVKKLIITPEDEFMVLACDGIWNYMSSEEVVDFVRMRLKDSSKKLSQICEELFDNCLAPNTMGDGTGCDNMTAVIVKFKQKLQELKTSLNPAETESAILEAAQLKKQDVDGAAEQSALKRSASPDASVDDDANECENSSKSKRLKIEDDLKSTDETAKISTDAISSCPEPSASAKEQKEAAELNSNTNVNVNSDTETAPVVVSST